MRTEKKSSTLLFNYSTKRYEELKSIKAVQQIFAQIMFVLNLVCKVSTDRKELKEIRV